MHVSVSSVSGVDGIYCCYQLFTLNLRLKTDNPTNQRPIVQMPGNGTLCVQLVTGSRRCLCDGPIVAINPVTNFRPRRQYPFCSIRSAATPCPSRGSHHGHQPSNSRRTPCQGSAVSAVSVSVTDPATRKSTGEIISVRRRRAPAKASTRSPIPPDALSRLPTSRS